LISNHRSWMVLPIVWSSASASAVATRAPPSASLSYREVLRLSWTWSPLFDR